MLGLLGGTFDPVHIGHVRLAIEIRERLRLDRVLLEVAARPPHRVPPQASAEDRMHMARLAVEAIDGIEADDLEYHRPGPSYMVDTLEGLKRREGNTPLALILGMDAFAGLHTWHRWERLLDLAHLILVGRPGRRPPRGTPAAQCLRDRLVPGYAQLCEHNAGSILELNPPLLDVSASSIRDRLRQGLSVRYLVPDTVARYIKDQGLYTSPR